LKHGADHGFDLGQLGDVSGGVEAFATMRMDCRHQLAAFCGQVANSNASALASKDQCGFTAKAV
jgi:hypothetical protein